MKGKHKVVIKNNRLHYEFEIKRNITIIKGDSATGKTTLINMIRQFTNLGNSSGIELVCDVPCRVLEGIDWQIILHNISGNIIFIDEENAFIKTEQFAKAVRESDNYFVLITRAYLPMLAYSIKEVYSMHVSGKYATLNNEYEITVNELQNVYSSTLSYPPRLITPDYVLCEDSNSGLEMFHALAEKVSAECHSAHGKSNIPEKVLDFEENKTYLIIVDGAAYGPEMGATVRYIEDHFNCYLYAPESFEWLLLKVMFSKDPMIYRILKNPSDYTESTKYLSWERYFTHVLEEHTKGTELEYHKKKLNKQYLYAKAMKILSKFLLASNINFDRCMV